MGFCPLWKWYEYPLTSGADYPINSAITGSINNYGNWSGYAYSH